MSRYFENEFIYKINISIYFKSINCIKIIIKSLTHYTSSLSHFMPNMHRIKLNGLSLLLIRLIYAT